MKKYVIYSGLALMAVAYMSLQTVNAPGFIVVF